MKDKYIVDSSVWIELERGNAAVRSVLDPLIARNAVCVVDVIVVELLRGTKTPKDFLRLQRAFADFVQLSAQWSDVAELAFVVARRGYYPPLIDVYIAQCALAHRKAIITQDRHFAQIARVRPFELMMV